MSDLDARLAAVARVPVLLVASDYDGTIAPIVGDPAQAAPHREAVVALRTLAALPQTHVAVISGRALQTLASLTGLPEDVHLVGSHGSEFDLDFSTSLPPQSAALRDRLREELGAIASAHQGVIIEEKPASIAFHYRNVGDALEPELLDKVLGGPGAIEGVYTKHGKKVVELAVVATNKGEALRKIRHRVGASAVVFFGDDRTDEDAFATLSGPDVAIKVGPGESQAPFRVDDPQDVARVLARLSELRDEWLVGAAAVPIERHSMLSDLRTIAIVTPAASVTWFCVPRIDSPSIFSELLGGPTAGRFSVESADGEKPVEQGYLESTLVLQTKWPTFTVTDFLDCSSGRPSQRAGRSDLIRIIEGRGRVRIRFAPRPDFSRLHTRIKVRDDGLEVEDTHDPIVLRAPGVAWRLRAEGDHQTAEAEVELTDSPLTLELRLGTGSLRAASTSPSDRANFTGRFWSSWSEQLRLPTTATESVRRSAMLLKGLCYGPTGAISAAGTMSLPEHIGGVRNWDYRYCWIRDAAMAASSLARLGCLAEPMHFLDWVFSAIDSCESPERLHPLYGVRCEELGPEAEISELAGYRGSRPVRVGNAAARQVQLDVFGPIAELIAQLAELDAPLSSQHWSLVEKMVHGVRMRWREPDHGIWEIRRPRRHHVHSKVMCWCTVDRAIRVSQRFLDRDNDDWAALRDEIAADVLEHGYKSDQRTFTAAYDGTDYDASCLLVGLSGLLDPSDDRFMGTVAAVEEHLRDGPVVYRYHADDGLPGVEGGFHLCTGWLIQSYVALGRVDEARALFEAMLALVGPTGLLSEQYEPIEKLALGNVPQAYSHLTLIDCALLLDGAAAHPTVAPASRP